MKPRVNLSLVLIIAFVFAAVRAEAAAKREAGGFRFGEQPGPASAAGEQSLGGQEDSG